MSAPPSPSAAAAASSSGFPASVGGGPQSLPLPLPPPSGSACLLLHVSATASSRLLSVSWVDERTHEVALGHFLEPMGVSVSAQAVSPLRELLQQYAEPLRASEGDLLIAVDEKKLPASEHIRLNAQVTQLEEQLQLTAVKLPHPTGLQAPAKSVEEARRQLARMLKGGLEPAFTVLEKHTPSAANAHRDASFSCLEWQMRHRHASMQSSYGQWQLSSVQLGAAPAASDAMTDVPSAQPLFMQLDPAAQMALNLFPAITDSDKNMSLHGLLNKGRTAMSGRLLEQWIKQPLTSMTEIVRRQNYVELLKDDNELRGALFNTHMKRLPDVDKLIAKLEDPRPRPASKSLEVLVSLFHLMERVPPILGVLQAHQSQHSAMLHEEFIHAMQVGVLEEAQLWRELILTTVDMEALKNHEYRVQHRLNAELTSAWLEVEQCELTLETLRMEAAETLGLESQKVKKLDMPTQGMVETRKDGVYFTSKELRTTSDAIKAAHKAFDAEQTEVVTKCMEVTSTYIEVFTKLNALLTELDCFLSLAHVAVNAVIPYERPTMLPMGTGQLVLTQARHPCVEAVLTSSTFIPNDIRMEKGKSTVQIITGPNMGGKSTYIRQTGVLCVMAQIGSFVPALTARMSIMDSVLARVGAGDSQQKGVSTFMAEMLEAASIVKQATPNSLVIIDELGRGTSTYDGFGLAWAITEHLATKTQCLASFATHFHELTALSNDLPCVRNLHVSAYTDATSITMRYQVEPGVSDRSFGVHVAAVANFPPQVVEMAREKARELEAFGGGAAPIVPIKRGDAHSAEPASPPSSQGASGSVSNQLGIKRVSTSSTDMDLPDPAVDEPVVPVEPALAAFLLEDMPSSVYTATGDIDGDAMEAWIKQLEARQGGSAIAKSEIKTEEATPMETA